MNQPDPRSLSLWVNRILLRVDSSRFAKSKESPHRQLSIRFLPLCQYNFTLRFSSIIIPGLGLAPLLIRFKPCKAVTQFLNSLDAMWKRKHDGEEDINDHKHKKSKHKNSKIDEMGAIKKKYVDEYEKCERLDLEDNDPEYETEEYGGLDYDDRGIECEEVQEEGEEIEEHEEEYIGDEGEGDMVEEEVEDVNEDLESEEDDDHVVEEHGQMVDEAEEDDHDEVVKERRKRKELEIFIDVVS
nr:heterogeneous nuclear ribonucleoprotein R-like isoform X1 [Ipomoea batatas]